MPKLVNRRVIIETIEEAVRRGLLALRYLPPGGGEDWFWHSPIEGIVDWADFSEVWLPGKATLNRARSLRFCQQPWPGCGPMMKAP